MRSAPKTPNFWNVKLFQLKNIAPAGGGILGFQLDITLNFNTKLTSGAVTQHRSDAASYGKLHGDRGRGRIN